MLLETLATILSILIPILSSIAYLGYWIGRRFTEVDTRFGIVEERFKQYDERLRNIERRIEIVDERFKEIDNRLGMFEIRFKEIDDRLRLLENRFDELKRYVDSRFDELKKYVDDRFNESRKYVDSRFNELKKYVDDRFIELKNYVDNRFNDLRSYIDNRVERIGRAFSSYQEFLIEYLSMKGVVSEKEVTILKNEAVRMSLLASLNPFTKEEWEKLKKYLDKDPNDFTLEEAEEFRELGRKAIREYWDRPEAYKLHIYTCVVYGLTLRKIYEKEKRESR
jgi:chromosome segregation ATPase